MLRVMALEAQMLTTEEFASLLTVGNAPVNRSAPAIPAAHSARLIALGFSPYLLEPLISSNGFNKIKQCRRVATRYDDPAAHYVAFVASR
jgi:hypothetical protein